MFSFSSDISTCVCRCEVIPMDVDLKCLHPTQLTLTCSELTFLLKIFCTSKRVGSWNNLSTRYTDNYRFLIENKCNVTLYLMLSIFASVMSGIDLLLLKYLNHDIFLLISFQWGLTTVLNTCFICPYHLLSIGYCFPFFWFYELSSEASYLRLQLLCSSYLLVLVEVGSLCEKERMEQCLYCVSLNSRRDWR